MQVGKNHAGRKSRANYGGRVSKDKSKICDKGRLEAFNVNNRGFRLRLTHGRRPPLMSNPERVAENDLETKREETKGLGGLYFSANLSGFTSHIAYKSFLSLSTVLEYF